MDKNFKMRELADEAVEIIKDVIINNDLVNGNLIGYVGRSESGDSIVIRDLLNYEISYSLSEVSCVFTDYIDCIGHMSKSVYKSVLSDTETEDYEKYKKLFMQSLERLREIEKSI